jgi:GSH-dependent disulfide-bond oxidoreductase
MFVATGIGPYCGQAVHFKFFAPEPKEYAVNRYTFEAERHWNIINEHLAGKQWMVGDTYTLVDMAVWGWSRLIPRFLGDGGYAALPNVKRHLDAINARPAAQRAEALKERFTFKTEMDDDAKKQMFPQNARLAKG